MPDLQCVAGNPGFKGVDPGRDGHGRERVGAPRAFKIVSGATPARAPPDASSRDPDAALRPHPPARTSASTRARTAGVGDAAAALATRTSAGGSGRPAATARTAPRTLPSGTSA